MDIPTASPLNHGNPAIRAGGALVALSLLIISSGCSGPSQSGATREVAEHSSHHPESGSPYAAHVDRQVKALSPEEVEALQAGEGMGMALAAELNGYPGPKHVLELAPRLGLDPQQLQNVRAIFEAMKENAELLGARIVSAEAELDRAFAARRISREELERRVNQIGGLRAALRTAHLQAHLETTGVLNAEQVQRYQQLRGYAPVRQ